MEGHTALVAHADGRLDLLDQAERECLGYRQFAGREQARTAQPA